MSQQFRVEYLRFNPSRQLRLPSLNATGSQFFNLSEEIVTSRTQKNLVKPKLQTLSHKKEDSKNFYHHSTIYNIKEFKELSKLQDYNKQNLTKYNEFQTKMMVEDFKKKVDAYIQRNNYKTSSKLISSLNELESFQSNNNGEQLNKSLCSNKYTIRTEYKSMKATEILVISNSKVVLRQIITSELIQKRLLKYMENFLRDDRYNYDLKMQIMIDQYEDIVNRIRQKAYTIKIPQNYEIQMSDYNEFYLKKEDPKIPSINNTQLNLLADQIIQEIQQQRQSTPTPQIQSQVNEEQQEEHYPYIDEVVKTEPVYLKEEETPQYIYFDDEQVQDRQQSQRKGKPRIKQQQNQQQQNEPGANNPLPQQFSQSDLLDIQSTQQFHQPREIQEKKNNQQILQPIQIQQQNHINFETDNHQQIEQTQNLHYVQNSNKKHVTHDKQKSKVHSRKVTGDAVVQRQVPTYLDNPKEQILETLSEKSHEETLQIEEIQSKKHESLNQEYQEIKQIENQETDVKDIQEEVNQQDYPILIQESIQSLSYNKQLHFPEQRDAVEIWDNCQPDAIKHNPKPKPIIKEYQQIEQTSTRDENINLQIIENVLLNQIKTSVNFEQQLTQQEILQDLLLKPNQNLNISENIEMPQTNQLLQVNKRIVNNQIKEQEVPNTNRMQEQTFEIKEQIDDLSKVDILQIINEKMKVIEQKLQQPCLDIFDILLGSDLVYNVNIENYKISKSYKKQFINPSFMFQQKDEEESFSHQVIWKHELQEVIPMLQYLNKQIQIVIDENDDYRGNSVQDIKELNNESKN